MVVPAEGPAADGICDGHPGQHGEGPGHIGVPRLGRVLQHQLRRFEEAQGVVVTVARLA
jgi:hypothetical protein